MKLERFGTLIDDYLEGTLGPEERTEIEAFLASSAEARRELAGYRRLVDSLGELPESIEPERDLFPAIEARIDEGAASRPSSRRSRHRMLWAAALAAALGLAYLTTRPGDPALVGPALAPAPPTALTATSRAEGDLLAATEQLKRALEVNRASLPPETRRLVERNLEIIQAAIAEIQLALDRDPGNQELNRALVAYYQHELALLEQVNRAASRL